MPKLLPDDLLALCRGIVGHSRRPPSRAMKPTHLPDNERTQHGSTGVSFAAPWKTFHVVQGFDRPDYLVPSRRHDTFLVLVLAALLHPDPASPDFEGTSARHFRRLEHAGRRRLRGPADKATR